ncbi:MAG: T9SS type A sorting domain-containing protein [Saprospiraceae bacterium]
MNNYRILLLTCLVSLVFGHLGAQPVNDFCSGAIPITPAVQGTGCSSASFILPFASDGTTDSGVPFTCTNPGNDQWFTWTATSDALAFTSLFPSNPGIAIFSTCADANTGVEIDCKRTLVNGTLSGWNVGDNLLIQLYDSPGQASDISFCLEEFTLPPPPVNDFCSGAIPITPALAGACCNTAGFIFSFSTDGTTDSGVPAVCSTPGKDRWFTWTASTDALKFTAKTPGGGGIAIFSDCIDASSGNTTNCFSHFFTDTTSSTLATLSGWSVGDDLLIQIFNSQTFDFDVAFCLQEFSLAPLPVTLVSFQGKEIGDNNVLSWITGAEQNTERHVVERSADGMTWEVLGERAAVGFSTVEQAYEFIDETPMSTSYYRLKSIDFDGSHQMSEVINLQRKEVGFSMNRIFPNPVTEMLFLDFSTDMVSDFDISITDLNGRVLYETEYRSEKGLNRHEIDVVQLPAGIYLINMQSGAMQITRRVVRI